MTTRNKNQTASREDQLKILKNKIQSIRHSDNILDSDAKFLTAELKTNTSEYATVEDIKKSEGKTNALIQWFVVTISISVIASLITLFADARRDHQNLEKILELQNNLQKAINDNQQLRQEIEWLRKEFDSKLENEMNKTIIEAYKLKLIRR